MSNIEIKHLFKYSRFAEADFKAICLLLYFPLGLVLMVLRAFLYAILMLLPYILNDTPIVQKVINKIACISLGISVTVENPERKENVDVFVSNSLSLFDHLAVHSVTGSVAPLSSSPLIKSKGLGVQYVGNQTNVECYRKNIASLVENKIPLYFAPEGRVTNGKGLLKFKPFPFQFANKVQPVCIKIERPLLDISLSTLGSSNFNDTIFFMFSPITCYKLQYLPALEKKNHSNEEFAEIIRHNIASGLKIDLLNYTSSDLDEFEKRQLTEERRAGVSPNSELQRMSLQVKEVLPHVPFNVIYKDLCVTKSIDSTITNILEGRVRFTPEQVPVVQNSPQPSTSGSSSTLSSCVGGSSIMFNTAAKSFAKSATERTKSFQERKEQLIASARKRYIERHNLNIPV